MILFKIFHCHPSVNNQITYKRLYDSPIMWWFLWLRFYDVQYNLSILFLKKIEYNLCWEVLRKLFNKKNKNTYKNVPKMRKQLYLKHNNCSFWNFILLFYLYLNK